MKDRFKKPKIRSFTEKKELKERRGNRTENYFFGKQKKKDKEMTKGLNSKFKNAWFMKRKKVEDIPYVLGYGGFRPHVIAQSYFGKDFRTESFRSINSFNEKQIKLLK